MIVAVGIILAIGVMSLILVLLLRRQLAEKYAVLWLLVGAAILILSVFPGLLIALARLLGVAVPSNLIFALAVLLLVGVTLHLSWELSRSESEIRRLAEEAALMRTDLDEIHARLSATRKGRTDQQPGDGHGF